VFSAFTLQQLVSSNHESDILDMLVEGKRVTTYRIKPNQAMPGVQSSIIGSILESLRDIEYSSYRGEDGRVVCSARFSLCPFERSLIYYVDEKGSSDFSALLCDLLTATGLKGGVNKYSNPRNHGGNLCGIVISSRVEIHWVDRIFYFGRLYSFYKRTFLHRLFDVFANPIALEIVARKEGIHFSGAHLLVMSEFRSKYPQVQSPIDRLSTVKEMLSFKLSKLLNRPSKRDRLDRRERIKQ
jgi:hypothetical protein